MWILEHKDTPEKHVVTQFTSKEEGQRYLKRMGAVISSHYNLKFESGHPITDRMLTEGMVKGDLYKIILPRISIDEFVPGDPATDNITIAFFLKGVPEATLPFKSFCEISNGALATDYGDSETVVGAQNVYVEFDRENLELLDIHNLIVQTAMLAGLHVDDFSMTFPHTDKKIPYDIDKMNEYFEFRNEKKNLIAQQRALNKAAKEFENDLNDARKKQKENTPNNAQESVIDFMSRVPLNG
jgi:hypothetical protein